MQIRLNNIPLGVQNKNKTNYALTQCLIAFAVDNGEHADFCVRGTVGLTVYEAQWDELCTRHSVKNDELGSQL
jgi:hypothetical protein